MLAAITWLKAKMPQVRSRIPMGDRFTLGAKIRVGQLFDVPNWPETPPH